MNNRSELMTVKELSELLKIAPRTIWRHVATGAVPEPIRIGRSVRWSRAKVEEWLAEKEKKSA